MMDDLIGAMLDIDEGVAEIMAWIDANGGYEKNAIYVTADHDHYLTLLPRKCSKQKKNFFPFNSKSFDFNCINRLPRSRCQHDNRWHVP